MANIKVFRVVFDLEESFGAERRESSRTPVRLRIKVFHTTLGEMDLYTADLSDTGVYILCPDQQIPPLGDELRVQVQGLPHEAPIVAARVVRVAADGMGLLFIA